MAWFLNTYVCPECGSVWQDEWSCCCDDECGQCGCRNISPASSEDRSVLALQNKKEQWEVFVSPETAEDDPEYQLVATLSVDQNSISIQPNEESRENGIR